MRKFTVLILLFIVAIAFGFAITDDSQAAPANLNNSALIVIVCDSDGNVLQDASEDM